MDLDDGIAELDDRADLADLTDLDRLAEELCGLLASQGDEAWRQFLTRWAVGLRTGSIEPEQFFWGWGGMGGFSDYYIDPVDADRNRSETVDAFNRAFRDLQGRLMLTAEKIRAARTAPAGGSGDSE
ncbi:hypothetical protein [Subtercola boreus]|uniref:Uncharacterized protein n=1 Tax=Subtercola boreus TaxID=120213 RepID=A0A3E0WE05_9MICO|nr:hypothetical protein [Subtercola boreus]RFA23466.1 hypothetical protein B7R24_00805 [Subtercola boreus]RFA23859.1 hypothetical protein B7R23_00805 [Subtercola boreus]RFA29560.1 hypothetical protein B7R25_00800 [Subtercola boreus]